MRARSRFPQFFITLLAVLAVVAVWTRVFAQTPRSKPEAKPEPPPISLPTRITVKDVFQGCFHHDEVSYVWERDGDVFKDGERQLSLAEVQALCKAAAESRKEIDLLSEYGTEIHPDLVYRYLEQLAPWIEPPSTARSELTVEALEQEAREQIVSEPSNCTSSIDTTVLLEGPSRVELHLSQADVRGVGISSAGLPQWQVSIGNRNWTTRSPRIAFCLQPLMGDKSILTPITEWPGDFARSKAAELAGRWGPNQLREIMDEMYGAVLTADKVEMRWLGSGHGWITLRNNQASLISYLDFHFDPQEDPTAELLALPKLLKKGEARLASIAWLRDAVKGRKVTLQSADAYEESWASHGFQGIPSYNYSVSFGESTATSFIVGEEDDRVVVFYPSDDLKKYLNNPPVFEDYKELVVTTAGTVEQVDWFAKE